MTNNSLNDAAAKLGEATAQATTKVKQFRRSRTDRMIAGVCGGAAKMLGIDAALLRILLVAATLFGVGAGAILYLAAWIFVPEEA